MSHNRTSNKITPKSKKYIYFFENGSYALRSSFFKGRMACKTAGMKATLLAFKGLLAYGKWSWCA
jgi:hypothetical protein